MIWRFMAYSLALALCAAVSALACWSVIRLSGADLSWWVVFKVVAPAAAPVQVAAVVYVIEGQIAPWVRGES
jgi:hypothetical protein